MKNKEKKKGGASFDDVLIGGNIRKIRQMRDYSQEKLASEIDVTFQQLQKYEKGVNRISASKLYKLANILDVNIYDFYEGLAVNGKEAPLIQIINPKILQAAMIMDSVEDKALVKQILILIKHMTNDNS